MPRPIGVNLQPEQRELISQLYLSGTSSIEIARQLGVSKSTVTRYTLRAGLREKVATAGRKLSPEEIQAIKQVYQNTLFSKNELTKKLGVSMDTVNYHTKGLERAVPPEIVAGLVEQYLAGSITADQVKALTGMSKHLFYEQVSKEVHNNG